MTTAAPVNTKTAPHRELEFGSIADIAEELGRIEAAHAAGTLSHTGNWTAGQIMDHCAKLFVAALDGGEKAFPAPMIWLIRAAFFKSAMGPKPMPRGFKAPKSFQPAPEVDFSTGLQHLRSRVNRVLHGEKMTHPSAIFGKMTHDQWEMIQRKHCAMHLGFLKYD
ncbi:MAG: DUF1569 domain-containing protein [Phycisphaeraceae bacterium]|nr:DUF1569 domain-containing protein [Phycisphaerales bacterium]MCB9861483.1 DUF1569 domain-containing protein [Phycisphaeraceae bacterium]